MKKMVLMGVVALTAASATLCGCFEENTSKNAAEKIPAKYRESVLSEIRARAYRQASDEMENKFGTAQDGIGWTNTCRKPPVSDTVRTVDGWVVCWYDKDGRLSHTGSEEWRWRENRQKEIQETLLNNPAVVDAAVSNAVAKSRAEFLEELIPLEEAIELAKNGKGKGYFQLALRYANGKEFPENARMAYQMLRKAVALNYANAILVEGLLDEESLKATLGTPHWKAGSKTPSLKDDGPSVRWALRKYCDGRAVFYSGRCDVSLTNEVAFARVMGKYEKAKALGAVTATNQIAALNKRLADFNQALAAEAQKKVDAERVQANNRKVHAVVGAQYRVAFKEMLGYEMGEVIAREEGDKTAMSGQEGDWRVRKLRMPYRDFTLLQLFCVEDRLCSGMIDLESKDKGTPDSLKQKALAVVKDLERRYGIELGGGYYYRGQYRWELRQYGWAFFVVVNEGNSMYVHISNDDLREELQEESKKRQKMAKSNPSLSAEKKCGNVGMERGNKKETRK